MQHFTIHVLPLILAKNHPPMANAGANQTLFLPLVSVDLDASNSTDDNKVVSYHWKVIEWVHSECLFEGTNVLMALFLKRDWKLMVIMPLKVCNYKTNASYL